MNTLEQEQELKALEYINTALDEIDIPRNTGWTRQTYTTWGRVSILIERYNQLRNHSNYLETPTDDSMTIRFSGGEPDYSDQPEPVSHEDEFPF